MTFTTNTSSSDTTPSSLVQCIEKSWGKIAAFWPLKNLIAANPLKGFEDMPFEEALAAGERFFQQEDIPEDLLNINRETIKWAQVFFDEGQSTIHMPCRAKGLYSAFVKLVIYDKKLITSPEKRKWIASLPHGADGAIAACMNVLYIPEKDQALFLTLMLTTLSGWSSYVKYKGAWDGANSPETLGKIQLDYLAVRLVLTCLIWPKAFDILTWYKNIKDSSQKITAQIEHIKKNEDIYRTHLLKTLSAPPSLKKSRADAQFLFCIDVRSEPFRRHLEAYPHYETFGVAGFFGLPISIKNSITQKVHASCPVLLKPAHTIEVAPCGSKEDLSKNASYHLGRTTLKKSYQSLKYNFLTPFILAEWFGVLSGFLMMIKTLIPTIFGNFKNYLSHKITPSIDIDINIDSLKIEEQIHYAESTLRSIGLTDGFGKLIILCGHESHTTNNAFASSLDCGACGGNSGADNAYTLAKILNKKEVRLSLREKGLLIPEDTYFISAAHNTTTDEMKLHGVKNISLAPQILEELKKNLAHVQEQTCKERAKKLGFNGNGAASVAYTKNCSNDWSQVQPEWGLAKNASFIVGPRTMTHGKNLEGRSFLHSYEHTHDKNGSILTSILMAPMVVAQWINSQYLFSALDNVAYGAGSKVTKNIVGKVATMQGNMSDLMCGLPVQSLYTNDTLSYHDPLRLLTVVYAPHNFISDIIHQHDLLKQLFANGWVQLISIDPNTPHKMYMLKRDLLWASVSSH